VARAAARADAIRSGELDKGGVGGGDRGGRGCSHSRIRIRIRICIRIRIRSHSDNSCTSGIGAVLRAEPASGGCCSWFYLSIYYTSTYIRTGTYIYNHAAM
jgi:hypothetical protein